MSKKAGKIEIVQFRDGKYAVRRTEFEGQYSFLDLEDVDPEKDENFPDDAPPPVVNWHGPKDKNYQPRGSHFDWCKTDDQEEVKAAYKLAAGKNPPTIDYGTPVDLG